MVRVLKLQKAVYVIILGIMAVVAAQIMIKNKVDGSNFILGLSGALLIIGALMLLYPIVFARKVDSDGDNVALKPMGKKQSILL